MWNTKAPVKLKLTYNLFKCLERKAQFYHTLEELHQTHGWGIRFKTDIQCNGGPLYFILKGWKEEMDRHMSSCFYCMLGAFLQQYAT